MYFPSQMSPGFICRCELQSSGERKKKKIDVCYATVCAAEVVLHYFKGTHNIILISHMLWGLVSGGFWIEVYTFTIWTILQIWREADNFMRHNLNILYIVLAWGETETKLFKNWVKAKLFWGTAPTHAVTCLSWAWRWMWSMTLSLKTSDQHWATRFLMKCALQCSLTINELARQITSVSVSKPCLFAWFYLVIF